MAEVVWTETALSDLDAIADYIALDDPDAARDLVQRVFRHVGQLATHPNSDSRPTELPGMRYRQIVEPPCRIFYRCIAGRVYVVYLMRGERPLRPGVLAARSRKLRKPPRRP